jgi:hypothetical protein
VESYKFYRYPYFDQYFLEYYYFGTAFQGIPPLGGGIQGGYSLWRYAEGKWVLEKDACAPGFESKPPQAKGTYEGEIRRTPGLPVRRPE